MTAPTASPAPSRAVVDHNDTVRTPIGASVPRIEDEPLLRGQGEFVDDIPVDGVLWARFVRSPLAHARLERIDVRAAAAAPGVVAVYTGADLSEVGPIVPPIDIPEVTELGRHALPADHVRFSGEAYAVVIATSAYAAEDAAELVRTDFAELPPLVDADVAAGPDAVRMHDLPSNVIFDRSSQSGDVDAVFDTAPVVFERTFRHARCSASPMETRAVLAVPDGHGHVHVHASIQIPHRLRTVLAQVLHLAEDDLTVTSADIGGSFGLKGHVYPEDVVVTWAALRLGRPVKFVEDRTENLLASSHARDQRIVLRVAADRTGKVLALDADVLSDIGAYGVDAHGPVLEAGGTPSMIPGPYDIQTYRFRTRAVCTTKCPLGAYRGVGLPMAVVAHERAMDILATELGLDRAEVRRRNLIQPDQMPYLAATGRTYDNGDYPRALEEALRLGGYQDRDQVKAAAAARGRLAGFGIASFVEYTGMNLTEYRRRGMRASVGVDSARVRLGVDGAVVLWTTMPSVGQGISTTFGQITSAGVGVELDAVTVLRSDTASSDQIGQGTGASRGMVVGGNAVLRAATAVRHQLSRDAAALLGVEPDRVTVTAGRIVVDGTPSELLTIADLVRRTETGWYEGTSTYESAAVCYSYATHVCVVEIDPRTGAVTVPTYVVADDCGRAVNPMIVKGQIRGGVIQGLGLALYEQHHYDPNGQLQTASFMDYLLPTATESPEVTISSFELPAPSSELGTKGMGESGTLGPPAVIANAIGDALGCEINELPVPPDRIRALLRLAQSERAA